MEISMPKLYDTFYFEAAKGDPDCGGLLAYNYFSGEHTTGFEEGRPMVVRKPDDIPYFLHHINILMHPNINPSSAPR